LHDTGAWIYDDMAYNEEPMFSPRSFEQVFLPAYRRMVRELIDLGEEGGLVISTHSISPKIPLALYEVYHRTCPAYGNYRGRLAISRP